MVDVLKKITYKYKDYSYSFDGACPICKCFFEPVAKHQNTYQTHLMDNLIHYEVYECPACFTPFMAIWESRPYRDYLELKYLSPQRHFKKAFDDMIKNISPDFVGIYHESERAEATGLLKICGSGYRKALEFLIKDYAVYLDPENAKQIEEETLHQTIQRLDCPKLQMAAKKCSWLGNDHVHYKFTHTNKDIQDMKNLLDVTVYWIMAEEITKQTLS